MATNSATEALLKAARDAESAADDMAKSFNEASASVNKVKQGFNGLGTGSVQFFTAMTDGQKGMSKYSSSMESAASGISSFLSLLGPIGMLAGTLVQGFAALSSAVFKSNDTVLEVYDTLADFGGVTNLTGDSLKEIYAKNTAAVINFNNLAKVTGSLGGNLIALGGTAGEGVKSFINIANVSKETIGEFSKLGFTSEKLTAVQANYIKNQVAYGTIRGKTDKDLQIESLKFAKELVAFSALTGKTTDEIQEIQKEAQNDYKFQSAMQELGEKEGEKSVKAFTDLNTRIAGNFGPTAAAALRDIIANKGYATTKPGLQLLAQTGGEISKILDDFGKDKDIDKVQKRLQELAKEREKSLGVVGRANPEVADAYGLNTDILKMFSKNFIPGRTDNVKTEIENKNLQRDKLLEDRAALQETTIGLNKAFQSFINLISGPIMTAFQGLLKGVNYLTDAFMNSWFARMLGITDEALQISSKPTEELIKMQRQTKEDLAREPVIIVSDTGRADSNQETVDQLKKRQNLIEAELAARAKMTPPAAVAPAAAPASPAAAPAAAPAAPAASPAAPAGPTDAASLARKLRGYRTGGIFNGPGTGYTVTDTDPMTSSLPKAVIPLPSGQEIPVSFKNLPKDLINKEQNLLSRSDDIGSILSEYMKAFIGSETPTTETMLPSTNNAVNMNDVLALVSEKMDNLISKMNQNAEVQNDLLILAKR